LHFGHENSLAQVNGNTTRLSYRCWNSWANLAA
jgi:hypothetical protein